MRGGFKKPTPQTHWKLCSNSGSPPGLEALPAENGTSLGWPEWHRSFTPTLRTRRMRLRSRMCRAVRALLLGLASLATLRLVLEVLVVEELLLSRRENELLTTIDTL